MVEVLNHTERKQWVSPEAHHVPFHPSCPPLISATWIRNPRRSLRAQVSPVCPQISFVIPRTPCSGSAASSIETEGFIFAKLFAGMSRTKWWVQMFAPGLSFSPFFTSTFQWNSTSSPHCGACIILPYTRTQTQTPKPLWFIFLKNKKPTACTWLHCAHMYRDMQGWCIVYIVGNIMLTGYRTAFKLLQIPETLWSLFGAAGSCPNKTVDARTRRSSSQARCCEVAKVCGPRWSPHSREQIIWIREVV